MRLYPPAWVMLRQSLTEIELGGYRIPKGAIVSITPYAVHRHHQLITTSQNHFGPNAFARCLSVGETPASLCCFAAVGRLPLYRQQLLP